MKVPILILFITCLSFSSCRKDAKNRPANLQTTVSGQFYDDFNREGYANLKLKIGEYIKRGSGFGPRYFEFVSFVDSGYTDTAGKYDIAFRTTGNGSSYFIEFSDIKKNVVVGDKIDPTPSISYTSEDYRRKQIEQIGKINTFNFTVHRQYHMKARVIVQNNPYPFLRVGVTSADRTRATSVDENNIYRTNNDTTLVIPIVKYSRGFLLNFSAHDPIANKVRQKSILINLVIDKDTIQGGPFTIDPSTF